MDLDTLVERQDANLTLTDTSLFNGTETDTLSDFELAELTGGVSPNTLDASAFTGKVMLDGGSTVLLSVLNGGAGVGTTDDDILQMTGATLLSVLNDGDGVGNVAAMADFEIELTDGQTVEVDISSASTVQDVLDAIVTAGNTISTDRLSATINTAGTALVLVDSVAGGSNIRVSALNSSPAAADLGILGNGSGTTLIGSAITGVTTDLRITLTDGTELDFDLTGLTTIQDVLELFNTADSRLTATVNASGEGVDLSDTAAGGGNLAVTGRNESTAVADLGIAKTGSGNLLTGSSIISGSIRLDGRLDPDTLIGSSGDDTLTGGGAADSLDGGGTDIVVEVRDANFTLLDASLTIGTEVDQLTSIESASLTGGAGNNTLDASGFTIGGVTLDGAAGNDILTGTANDDVLTGGIGIDSITGGGGTDTLVETGDVRFVLTNSSLDMAEGTNEVQTITLTSVTSGDFTLTFDGETTTSIAYDATASVVKSALTRLFGIGDEDIEVVAGTNSWTVTFSSPPERVLSVTTTLFTKACADLRLYLYFVFFFERFFDPSRAEPPNTLPA